MNLIKKIGVISLYAFVLIVVSVLLAKVLSYDLVNGLAYMLKKAKWVTVGLQLLIAGSVYYAWDDIAKHIALRVNDSKAYEVIIGLKTTVFLGYFALLMFGVMV